MSTKNIQSINPQERRPEVGRLAEKLAREHSDWSWSQCAAEAKATITNKFQCGVSQSNKFITEISTGAQP